MAVGPEHALHWDEAYARERRAPSRGNLISLGPNRIWHFGSTLRILVSNTFEQGDGMGLLDKLLGRSKQMAEKAAEVGKDVAGDAFDKGKGLASEGLDKAGDAMKAASDKLTNEDEAPAAESSEPPTTGAAPES
jgi:hypothetical protein